MGRRRRKLTAYHEAGHVIAAYHFDQQIGHASIEPDDETSGRMTNEDGEPDETVVVLMAGLIAAQKVDAEATGGDGDEETISEWLPQCKRDRLILHGISKWIVESNWLMVERVASYLLEFGHLGGQVLEVVACAEVTEQDIERYLVLAGLRKE